jgi:hypothetical protein
MLFVAGSLNVDFHETRIFQDSNSGFIIRGVNDDFSHITHSEAQSTSAASANYNAFPSQ